MAGNAWGGSTGFPNLPETTTPALTDITIVGMEVDAGRPKKALLSNLPFVPKSGGTMTGLLTLSGDPTTALQAVTKQYADAIAGGFTVKQAAVVSTTANLTATSAGAGVGATLTNSGAMAAFSADGVSPAINSRILVPFQTLSQHNGIYTLTTVGSGASNWVLTRATDYDQAAEIKPGTLVPVTTGTLYAQTSWIETATVVTVDTDPITFSQFTASPNSFANTHLSNLASVAINTTLLPAADGTIDLGSAAFRFKNALIETIQTGTTNGNTVLLQAYNGATYTTFATLTANATPTMSLASAVTGTTQAANDNSTKLATTAYVDASAATGANVHLSNLSAVAINTVLLSAADNTMTFGTAANRWTDIYGTHYRTGQSAGHTFTLDAYDVDGASYTTFATLTANNTPTMALSSDVTGVTQAASDSSTKLATTLYADTQVSTIAANKALSNLASVAINTALLPGADNTIDLGDGTHRFRELYGARVSPGSTTGNTLILSARNVGGASDTTFITLTSDTTTPTCVIASAVTATTQAALDNSTKLATTAYVDAATGGGSGANVSLSNLSAVAINTSLLPGSDNAIDLGSGTKRFRELYGARVSPGSTTGNTLILSARNVGGASDTTFITLTSDTTTPTAVIASAVTATTQSALDNSTKLATTAYVDAAVTAGTGANTALSNLASVAINTDLLGSADNSRSLGSATVRFKDVFPVTIKTGTSAGNNYILAAYDTNAATYTTFATLTANNPATMVLASGVTGTTQTAGNNSTKLATTAYADRMVPLAGGTMSGLLLLSADPVAALGAVTKQYADAIAAGFDVKTPCYAATTANLNATYLNGVAGVGATLVNAGALAAFTVDGQSPPVNSRILTKNQTSTFQNGIYVLSTVGSGAVAWVLTRATDYDQAPSEIFPGNLIIINNGTVNGLTSWVETATVTTIGTDPITFSQFSAAPLTFPLTVTQGGTGVATLTTAYGTLCAGTTATGAVQTVATGTSGQALVSAGNAALPAYGTLGVVGGGTGLITMTTAYSVVCAGTTATGALQIVAPSATALPLVSGGTSALPSYVALTVAGGGTGQTSATAYAVLCGGTTSTGAHQSIAGVGTSGQVLTSNGAGALPTMQTIGAGGQGRITATGGTITTSGSYTIHTFNSTATWTVTAISNGAINGTVDVLVVGGGGGGGGNANTGFGAGGGGAGGVVVASGLIVGNGQVWTATVGAAGAAGASGGNTVGGTGGNSTFMNITGFGGGGGGVNASTAATSGGSGGGSAFGGAVGATTQTNNGGGTGSGFAGGLGAAGGAGARAGGGGGGAGAVGAAGTSSAAGNGGVGISNSYSGSAVFYGGGGGGGTDAAGDTPGTGGNGGGGNGSNTGAGNAGTANTGGGGGGSFNNASLAGGAGGTGVIIVRYLT